jgi:hypothetical protein
VACAWGEEPVARRDGAGVYDGFFARRSWEGTVAGGVLFSPALATGGRPQLDYAMGVMQAGYMFTEVRPRLGIRGNWEGVAELFGGGFYRGHGTGIAGLTLWSRYNFVPRDWRLTPYAQVGLGLGWADKDKKIFGSVFGFNLDAAVGTRIFLQPRLALTAEYRFQHISNANIAPHNLGINAHGPMVGCSWLF